MNTPAPNPAVSRRHFVQSTGLLGAALALGAPPAFGAVDAPSDRVRVAVMGLGRGLDHVKAYLQIPNVEIVHLCDVDERRVAAAVKVVVDKTGQAPRGGKDFRVILDDPSVDALSIAAPNFWHAPATVLACAAGKHVYVEKPGSQTAREGEVMVEAARRHDRRVQMGNQRRSLPEVIDAIAHVRAGEIGTVRFARCWYDANRGTIGRGAPAPIPTWLDYALWQGPIPERPYVDNLVHYNWHWRWHWGGGELANNGIHALDVARWGLGVDYPERVTINGGRYHFHDDQETPDTIVATFDFGSCGASWDSSSCLPRKEEKHPFVAFYGDRGTLALDGGAGYRVFDLDGKELRSVTGRFTDVPHFTNFIEAIRSGTKLNSEIGEGQKSTRLCHLGNIAYRTGATLAVESGTGRIQDPTRAMKRLWTREYRPGWEPKLA